MQPVWVLSVDLQTKTATFQSGLSDAAKSARGAFTDIKGGAGEMGRATSGHMMEARHSVMMLGEEFGIHLPRALTSFIAGLGPVGAALEMAFPFLAIATMATLLIQKIEAIHAAGIKLTEDQVKFGTAVNNAWGQLDQKLIQAGIKADELRNDHLGALRGQLDLIDRASMAELVHSFEEVAKAGDVVMKELEGHWYTWGKGSEGAKSALDQFQAKYQNLLSTGKDGDAAAASGLLHGTAEQAQKVLGLLEQLQKAGRSNQFAAFADPAKFKEANDELTKMGIAHGEEVSHQIEAQQNLVGVLNAQIGSEERIAAIKKLEGQNATTSAHKSMDKEAEEAARKAAEEQTRLDREYAQNFKRGQDDLVNATQEGTAARLNALQSAMSETEALYGRDNETYKQFANAYLRTETEMGNRTLEAIASELDEEDKLRADAGKEQAENALKMGELSLAAEKQANALRDSAQRQNIDHEIAEARKLADEKLTLVQQAFAAEGAALDKNTKDYANKLKAIQDKEKQATRQHENDISTIEERAEIERNQRILAARQRFNDELSAGLTQVLMGHESFTKMVNQLGDQVVSGMIQNAIKSMLVQDMTKEKDAAAAARKAFNIGMSVGGPAGIVLGPVMGAAAFAAVMAFAGGGITPGIGTGDTVPAMLTPGEPVLPVNMAARLNRAMDDNGSQGNTTVVHVRPTYNVQALDGDGLQTVLTKHTAVLEKHFQSAVRKLNR